MFTFYLYPEQALQYRNEYKFICDNTQMIQIEDSIRTLCFRDPHSGKDGKYCIRSLYYDTSDDKYYFQTKNGEDSRYKYRIRIYNRSDGHISLERKESLHGKKRKVTQCLSRDEYDRVFISGPDQSLYGPGPLLNEFISENNLYLLEPRVIIEYSRTPYIFPIGNVRITFDRHLLAAFPQDIFAENLSGINILEEPLGILEVKYDDLLPGSIQNALSYFNLMPATFSKYTRAREALAGYLGELS